MDCHSKVLGRWQKESNSNRSEDRIKETVCKKEIGTTRAKAATIGIPHVSQRAASELIMDD
ncbi:hypothetical protein OIU77_015924 [Salix suchowensis]|uniref:Uncharacterized protein n=1 Tax=Salix suchowensis TaxID=1278906 RepID=A0ABQ8ZIP2_9ROSI|nr:hypothetical protein OIU77_015924 [Salix suchowensis]